MFALVHPANIQASAFAEAGARLRQNPMHEQWGSME
jgi:hypothetical protein